MPKHLKVIAIGGGKGGVGKTQVAVNLAIKLAQLGHKTVLFDADFGLSNVDIALGLKPKQTLQDVVEGRAQLADILMDGPEGLKILPGASGVEHMAQLGPQASYGLIQDFMDFYAEFEYLIIDIAAGISSAMMRMAASSDEIVVVANDDPASLADAYAMIKVLNKSYHVDKFKILINRVDSCSQANQIFAKLTSVADRYLSVVLQLIGWINDEPLVKKAQKQQNALVCAYPSSQGAKRMTELAQSIAALPSDAKLDGNSQFFVQRFLSSTLCSEAP